MVAAKNGTITLVANNGASRTLSIYASDVVSAFATISTTGLAVAGSDNQYIAQAPGVIRDFSMTTGLTATTAISVLINGVAVGHILDVVAFVSTAATRPPLAIPFKAGDKLQFVQV